ncbi:hypothetical protein ES703_111641 [subsurface metagenome]
MKGINLPGLETELQEVAGNITLKVRRHNGCRVSIRETDKKLQIRINPKRIRNEKQLGEVREFCFGSLEC